MQPINNACISVSGCEGQENALPGRSEVTADLPRVIQACLLLL